MKTTEPGITAPVVRASGARTREASVPKAIRTRINQLAHHCALRHEAQIKAGLLEQMQHMASAGANLATMAAAMDGHHDNQQMKGNL